MGAVCALSAAVLVTPAGGGLPATAAVSPPVRLAQLRTHGRGRKLDLGRSDKAAAADLRDAVPLVVVDGETTSANRVRTLQAGGSVVLAYLSIGTIKETAGGAMRRAATDWTAGPTGRSRARANVNNRGFRLGRSQAGCCRESWRPVMTASSSTTWTWWSRILANGAGCRPCCHRCPATSTTEGASCWPRTGLPNTVDASLVGRLEQRGRQLHL